MGMKLYVGNLGYGIRSSDLERLFAAHGTVRSAEVITDRTTGQSKGFGFVEMGSEQEAKAAIAALNGKEMDGRPATVNEARPKEGGGGHGQAATAGVGAVNAVATEAEDAGTSKRLIRRLLLPIECLTKRSYRFPCRIANIFLTVGLGGVRRFMTHGLP